MPPDSLPLDLIHQLNRSLSVPGSIQTDPASLYLYSTDASIYQAAPLGVVFPRTVDDISSVVEISSSFGVPVIARGAGSGLAGQAIGRGIILDCSRFLNRILHLNVEEKYAEVEPGVVLNDLNKVSSRAGLQFGPDPASAERATIGGSIANNATGAHSIQYGMAADHLRELDVVLSDGSNARLSPISLEEMVQKSTGTSREALIYQKCLDLRERYRADILSHWPKVWRRASGYGIHYLLPWSPSRPPGWPGMEYPASPGRINLCSLVAGSEGTLAIIRKAKLNLVEIPRQTVLSLVPFNSIAEACDAVPGILETHPSAIELIPRSIITLARQIPAYSNQLIFLEAQHEAVLVVEYSGNDSREILWLAKKLANHIAVAESLEQQKQIWNVRKAGLGIIQSRPGDLKPLSFIEDLSVPVEELGKFIREIEKIMSSHGTTSEIYAHASAGCLHIRPFVNVKTSAGIRTMREIAEEAVELTIHLGGSISGEHGDGFARSEWLERMYGRQLIKAFKELKEAADPREILNPGKKVGLCQETEPPRMDENLRYGSGYQVTSWQPVLSFDQQGGLPGAIEQCNGAGVCRKSDGVMCPSFQASGEEMHSTRGRANLLRAMISAAFQSLDLSEKYVYEALDLCLACKGCKSECPSSVDMAKLKYEFLHHYYQSHPRKSRDSLFGFIEYFLRLGQPVPWLVNPLLRSGLVKKAADQYLGISQFRSFPALAKRPLRKLLGKSYYLGKKQVINPGSRSVFFLSDAFTEYMYPETGVAAVRVLEKAGFKVYILPFSGAGRTYLSKGFLEAARSRAMEIYAYVTRADPANRVPVVGVEPSEIYALRDEYPDLLDPTGVDYSLAGRSWMIDEFLLRQISGNKLGELRIDNLAAGKDPSAFPKVLLHGHCYQKTQPPMQDGLPVGVNATIALLNQFGCEVRLIESSCCGMAGAFGYESEHYHFSMQVGELKLFPAIRSAGEEWVISTSGVSCHSQIQDGTSRTSLHPIQLIYHLVQSS